MIQMKRWGKYAGLLVMMLGGAILIFFLWASSGSYAPHDELVTYDIPEPPEKTDGIFRVVTYNIGYFSGMTNNLAVERSRASFLKNQQTALRALRSVDADIIALQEADLASSRSFKVNQVAEIAKGSGLKYGAVAVNWNKNYVPFPYFPLSVHFGRMVSAQAVLSRYPIKSQERIVLEEVEGQSFLYKSFYIDRLAQITELSIDERSLILINVHLEAFDEDTRRRQTEFLLELLSRYPDTTPIILLGDFNSGKIGTGETHPSISLLLEHPRLKSAIPEHLQTDAEQLTFPSDAPSMKLDYIFYTPNTIALRHARVVKNAEEASDHLPVMMEWAFIP